MPAVVIAASNLISSLCNHLESEGELMTFADTEPIQALQTILEQHPDLIVLERLFAATPRGAALINRIRTDPQLTGAQVRVMSHTGDYIREITRSPAPAVTAGASAATVGAGHSAAVEGPQAGRALDWHGTRRALRHPLKPGVEIQLDGNPVSLVDMSTAGAQVLSATILRPNQKVRVTIPQDESVVRCRGAIAWAKFELARAGGAPVYRAGIEFLDVDTEFVEQFSARHRR